MIGSVGFNRNREVAARRIGASSLEKALVSSGVQG
jgi:hypothetical protein